jgi:multiple sugar transport system substrate-binding protein
MNKILARVKQSLGVILLVGTLVTTGLGCNAAVTAKPVSAKPVTLSVWGVYDDEDAYSDIFKAYQALHPNVSFDFRKFRPEEYEKELLNAFAEDRGPDVYMVHNTWMHAYEAKLLPMPKSTKVAFREIQGVKKDPVWVVKTVPSLSLTQVQNQFIDQVGHDVIINGPVAGTDNQYANQVYGLPLSVDTLGLYYNKDALNAAGIPTPAQSWTELQDHVKRLTQYDSQGKLKRPAVGLGTFQNVNRALDIISLLMMQNGTQMSDDNGNPSFQRMPAAMTRDINPGLEALTFYTDFANPTKDVFTWDDTQPNSLDAFVAGVTAYYFGYSADLATIRAQAPKLNFGITTVPQIDPQNFPRNFASYWNYGVAKKSKYPDLSWNLVQFMTSEAQAKSYLTKAARPTALRSLIPSQIPDGDLGPFASELLTAVSWYHGSDVQATMGAFSDLVKSVLAGTEPQQALNLAAEVVGQTIH